MAYGDVVAALKALLRRDLFDLDEELRAAQFREESDRAVIILLAAHVERWLGGVLVGHMATINAEETTRLFDFNGPLGTFSSKTLIAQAFGLIDRPTRKKIDLLREMRNAAAHAHDLVTFETPEIREAALTFIDSEARPMAEIMDAEDLRTVFLLQCILLSTRIYGDHKATAEQEQRIRDTIQRVYEAVRPPSH